MQRRAQNNERGDTLVEILFAIVLIGLLMGVLFASFTMSSTGSNNQKNLAKADGVLRNYAETAKNAVKSCASSTQFSVPTPAVPDGFAANSVSSTPDLSVPTNCPTTDVLLVQLNVTVPNISAPKELDVALRAP